MTERLMGRARYGLRTIRIATMLSVATAATALLWSPHAWSKSRLVAVVAPSSPSAEKASNLVAHFLRSRLMDDTRYDVVDLRNALGGADFQRAERNFRVAAELIEKGRGAYDTLELDAAVEYLSSAVGKYERSSGYIEDFAPMAEALMLLGATHILRGEERQGARRLVHALTIFPDAEADPRVFNPGMRRLFQRLSEERAAAGDGGVTITSTPSHGRVYLDGEFLGVTPVTVDGVQVGRHFLRIDRDGYRAFGRPLELKRRRRGKFNATLRPANHHDDYVDLVERTFLWVSKLSEEELVAPELELADAVDQLGVLANADALLLVQVAVDGDQVDLSAHQFDLNAARLSAAGKTLFAYDPRPRVYRREINELLATSFNEETMRKLAQARKSSADPLKVVEAKAAKKKPKTCVGANCDRSGMLTLAIGGSVGVALLGAGGLLWALAQNDQQAFDCTGGSQSSCSVIQGGARANALQSNGEAKALVGDILMGVGGAAVLASLGVFLYKTLKAPKAADPLALSRNKKDEDSQRLSFEFQPRISAQGGGMAVALRF